MIPESQDAESLAFQILVSPSIIFLRRALPVLSAVQFDDYFYFQAYEIDHVGTDRTLPAKLVSQKAAITEPFPEKSFRIRLMLAECSTECPFPIHPSPPVYPHAPSP